MIEMSDILMIDCCMTYVHDMAIVHGLVEAMSNAHGLPFGRAISSVTGDMVSCVTQYVS